MSTALYAAWEKRDLKKFNYILEGWGLDEFFSIFMCDVLKNYGEWVEGLQLLIECDYYWGFGCPDIDEDSKMYFFDLLQLTHKKYPKSFEILIDPFKRDPIAKVVQ